MSFEVYHHRKVTDSIAVDIDMGGRGDVLIEVVNDEIVATIALSTREVRALIRDLQSWLPPKAARK